MGALPPLASMFLCTAQQLSLCLCLCSGFCFPICTEMAAREWSRSISTDRQCAGLVPPSYASLSFFQHVEARTFGH
ncbi:hypothetical protein V8C40DRAFT_15729 [Trichoderma camerunense]